MSPPLCAPDAAPSSLGHAAGRSAHFVLLKWSLSGILQCA